MKTLYELAGELLQRGYHVKLDQDVGDKFLRVEIPKGYDWLDEKREKEKKKAMEDAKFKLV